MTAPSLVQFSLILPWNNVIFWVLHYFVNQGNWGCINQGLTVPVLRLLILSFALNLFSFFCMGDDNYHPIVPVLNMSEEKGWKMT